MANLFDMFKQKTSHNKITPMIRDVESSIRNPDTVFDYSIFNDEKNSNNYETYDDLLKYYASGIYKTKKIISEFDGHLNNENRRKIRFFDYFKINSKTRNKSKKNKQIIKQAKTMKIVKKSTPYSGTDSYIFISYAHKDKKEVYPIIEKLLNDGFRIWYDDGIDPGTEWDENIAKHIEECGYFIPFISENYLKSSNCKDELNFARDLEKDRFLIYLENVDLPLGMNMRLSRLQNIHKYAYDSFDEFYNKLLTAKGIDSYK